MAAARSLVQEQWVQPGFQFHEKRGIGIQLTNDRQTARRRSEFVNGIVMSSAPMFKNVLYEVHVDTIDNSRRAVYVSVGVVTQPPDTITVVNPLWALASAVVVSPLGVNFNKDFTKATVKMSPLGIVKQGSRIGVMVDAENFLHLLKDGHDLGRVTPNPALPTDSPIHAMFDLGWPLKQVTTLPLRNWTPQRTRVHPHLVQCIEEKMEELSMARNDFDSKVP